MYIFARKLKYRRIRSVIDFKNYTRNNLDIDVQLEDYYIHSNDQGYFDELELENIRFLVQFRTCSGGPVSYTHLTLPTIYSV